MEVLANVSMTQRHESSLDGRAQAQERDTREAPAQTYGQREEGSVKEIGTRSEEKDKRAGEKEGAREVDKRGERVLTSKGLNQ